eukprot:5424020-Pyramimonas_sp.AAC.1
MLHCSAGSAVFADLDPKLHRGSIEMTGGPSVAASGYGEDNGIISSRPGTVERKHNIFCQVQACVMERLREIVEHHLDGLNCGRQEVHIVCADRVRDPAAPTTMPH